MHPYKVNPIVPPKKRMRSACSAEVEATPILAKIIPIEVQIMDSSRYLMPEVRFFMISSLGERSHNIQVTPVVVRRMPIHVKNDGNSRRKTTAKITVNTGPSVPNNTVNLGPNCIKALKNKVSPMAIPSKPLAPRIRNSRLFIAFMPVSKSIIPMYKIPIKFFPRFIPRGETLLPSLRNRIEPSAQEKADAKEAKLPSIQ